MENKFTKTLVKELVERSFNTSSIHGFHDEDYSDEHYMMLVVSEIGEMVEADRKNRHANLSMFRDNCNTPQAKCSEQKHWDFCFEQFVKDTFEDELSDVVIRLFDYLGTINTLPFMLDDGFVGMSKEFDELFGQYSTCEHCYALTSLVMEIARSTNNNDKAEAVGAVLSMAYELSKRMGFNLLEHVTLKMQYNEHREPKHGKRY